jgi:hypothetical protein
VGDAFVAQVADQVKIFSDYRTWVNRLGAWLIIVPPILLALSRSPDFQLEDVFGLVRPGFHNGYVGAYGHFVVLSLATWYFAAWMTSRQLHQAVESDLLGSATNGKLSQTEHFLLRPPFWFGKRESKRTFKYILSGLPLLTAALVYFVFLWNYFQFHAENREESGLHDLFLGAPGQGGFHGAWNRVMPSQPWINAPWQTWISIAGAAVMLVEIWLTYVNLRKYYKE